MTEVIKRSLEYSKDSFSKFFEMKLAEDHQLPFCHDILRAELLEDGPDLGIVFGKVDGLYQFAHLLPLIL